MDLGNFMIYPASNKQVKMLRDIEASLRNGKQLPEQENNPSYGGWPYLCGVQRGDLVVLFGCKVNKTPPAVFYKTCGNRKHIVNEIDDLIAWAQKNLS